MRNFEYFTPTRVIFGKDTHLKIGTVLKEQNCSKVLIHYGSHFWLMFEDERLIAFVDGMVTDESDLTDKMYEKAQMHDENGAWQMIFGVNTIPAFRNRGCAGQLIQRAIEDARSQGRKGLVLTCKDKLVPYYSKFGFRNEGVSEKSIHGGVTWNQMRLTFRDESGCAPAV